MNGAFAGKVVVITGGGRGIGRATALLMAREGARVVVNDLGGGSRGGGRDESVAQAVVEEIAALGGEAVAETSDISTMSGAESAISKAIERFGRLDILVAGAAIARPGRVDEISEESFDRVLAVGLKGVFAAIKYAAPHLIRQRGSIVTFSSPSGFGHYGMSNYTAAKEGVVGLSRSVARDLGAFGVRCNVVRPFASGSALGTEEAVKTMLHSTQELGIPALGHQIFAPTVGLGGPFTTEPVAAVVAWLCTDHATALNGREVYIAGSQVALVQEPELIRSLFKAEGWDFEGLCSDSVSAALTYDQRNRLAPRK